MSLKEFTKAVVSSIVPNVVNNRFIRINTEKEPETLLLPLMGGENRLAIDVGANQGLYVHHLLSVTNKVVAFEPLLSMQKKLRQIYSDRIRLEAVALSDAPGTAELRFPEGEYPLATLEQSNNLHYLTSQTIRTQKTEVKTLDSYNFGDVGIVKIDVEGHEEAVIKGGMTTLQNSMPFLIIEIEERHNKGAVKRVCETLGALGYAGLFISDGRINSVDDFDISRDQMIENISINGKIGRYINNFIFVPNDRLDGFVAGANDLLAGMSDAA